MVRRRLAISPRVSLSSSIITLHRAGRNGKHTPFSRLFSRGTFCLSLPGPNRKPSVWSQSLSITQTDFRWPGTEQLRTKCGSGSSGRAALPLYRQTWSAGSSPSRTGQTLMAIVDNFTDHGVPIAAVGARWYR